MNMNISPMFQSSINGREYLSAQITANTKFIMQPINMTEHQMLFLFREITNTTEPELVSFYVRTQQHHCVYISFSFFLCFDPTFKNQKILLKLTCSKYGQAFVFIVDHKSNKT